MDQQTFLKFIDRIVDLVKFFKPKQRKWLVTSLVVAGIAAITQNWWEPVLYSALGTQGINIPDASGPGWILLLLGIGIHITNRIQDYFEKKNQQHSIVNNPPGKLEGLSKEFGLIINAFRNNERLSREELASLIDDNLNPSEIDNWENGSAFPFKYLSQILDIINVSEAEFNVLALKHLPPSELTALQNKSHEKATLKTQLSTLRRVFRLGGDDRTEPIIIIAPFSSVNSQYRDESSPNYVFLDNLGDRDSLLELATILARLYPLAPIYHYHSKNVPAIALENDLILLGGTGFSECPNNHIARNLIEVLGIPLYYENESLIFDGQEWSAKYAEGVLESDVGLFSIIQNPWNNSKKAILFQGIHTSGVLGSVRAFSLGTASTSNHHTALQIGKSDYVAVFDVRLFGSRPVTPRIELDNFFVLDRQ